ncbi:hypothetical protein MUK42_26513 [Musa troglodytarum]|nr:hypothetical protein MUK42_26513 [Musa troglodytarum]
MGCDPTPIPVARPQVPGRCLLCLQILVRHLLFRTPLEAHLPLPLPVLPPLDHRQSLRLSSPSLSASTRCVEAASRDPLPPPLLSLRHLVFMVDVYHGDAPVLSLAVTGEELESLHGIFRFEVRIGDVYKRGEVDAREELRVVWMVVPKECREAFTLIDYVGKGTSVGSNVLWFSEKLPCPSSCYCSATMDLADLEAEVLVEICCDHDGAKKTVAKVSFGLMNTKAWRYVKVADGLLYLQSFLLPWRHQQSTILTSVCVLGCNLTTCHYRRKELGVDGRYGVVRTANFSFDETCFKSFFDEVSGKIYFFIVLLMIPIVELTIIAYLFVRFCFQVNGNSLLNK